MIVTRFASFLTFALATSSFVFASPVTIPGTGLAGRSIDKTSDVINIFSTLKSTTNEALPQLRKHLWLFVYL